MPYAPWIAVRAREVEGSTVMASAVGKGFGKLRRGAVNWGVDKPLGTLARRVVFLLSTWIRAVSFSIGGFESRVLLDRLKVAPALGVRPSGCLLCYFIFYCY